MKRILFLSFYLRPDLCAGSFRNSPLLNELSRQTRDNNILIDVFTTQPNRYASYKNKAAKIEEFDNVRIERIDIPNHNSGIIDQILSFKSYFFEVFKKTKEKNYDLVYASSSRFFTSWLGYRMARKKNAPLYVDVRDIFSETLRDLPGNPFIRIFGSKLVHLLEKRVYNYSSHLNLISEGFLPSFGSYPKQKITTYTHGIDPAFTNFTQNSSATEQKPDQKIEVLYAGNIGHAQALHEILPDIANALKMTHRFTVIGDGSARDLLKRESEQQKLSNLDILDPVQREKLIHHYKEADILFLNLKNIRAFNKVLPSKLFEYGAAGKPIVAGLSGYAKEFIEEHFPESKVFTPGDPADAIRVTEEISGKEQLTRKPDRNPFIEQFSRNKIDQNLATSIINTT